jgi:hypothetical protein
MQSRSALAATLATAASLFFAVPASADETPPQGLDDPPAHSSRTEVYPVPRPPLPVPEDHTLVPQLLLGGLTAIAVPVALAAALTAAKADTVPTAATIALVAPLALGGVVCAIGKHSPLYDGPCLAPIGGAMVVSLGTLGLVVLAESHRDPSSDVDLGPPLLLFAGWLIAEPAVAIACWRSFRKLRPGLPPPVGPTTALVMPGESRRGQARLPGERVVPLLALTF